MTELKVKLLRDNGYGHMLVKGGPFDKAVMMDWRLVEGETTVGLVFGEKPANAVNAALDLRRLLISIDALVHLKARFHSGYLEVPPTTIGQLEALLRVDP